MGNLLFLHKVRSLNTIVENPVISKFSNVKKNIPMDESCIPMRVKVKSDEREFGRVES